ncbi:amino acid adenylation domain-containing protein, partial [Gordonia soli]
HPVWNTTTWVLDARLRPVPAGVPGELYLGGVQIARGYAGRPDLSAERFVADPFGGPGERLYRTGDLVRWNTTGEIEYLGRTDFQVKLRGQRIELGEIESVIASVPGVVHTAATVVAAPSGAQHLVAYVSPATVDLDAVRTAVAESLPEYMRPSVWMPIEHVSLNSAGKLDRRALPAPDLGGASGEFVAAASGDEQAVAAVFADVLGLDEISVTAGFFDAGGNSLSAMRLASRVGDVLDTDVSVRDLFEAPSVRELVAAVAGRAAGLAPVVAVRPRPSHIPLSFAQQRMWFINQFDPTSATYNIPVVLRLSGTPDVDALHAALGDAVVRHEVLRTTFPSVDGVAYQVVEDAESVTARLDWAVVDSQADLERALTRGFDVSREWPVRARLWTAAEGEHVLAVVVHHIAADGESMVPLIGDVVAAYTARTAGVAPTFTPLEVQFADYAIWQHAVLGSAQDPGSVVGAQLAYWTDQLAGLPDVIDIPTDRARPAVASHRGAQVGFTIPARVVERITDLAAARSATPFMVVQAALSVLLGRLAATDDVAVATPIAGRGQRVLDPVVGMFVNTLVLRARLREDTDFAGLVDEVRTTGLDAFANADVPFETVVESLNPTRSEAFSPLAQVMLTFDQVAVPATASGGLVGGTVAGLEVTPVEPPQIPAQLDLTVTVGAAGAAEDWTGSVVYATDLFDQSTAAGLAERFVRLLDDLTADPTVGVADVEIASAAEQADVAGWARGATVSEGGQLLPDAIAARAAEAPDDVALTAGGREMTYGEFGARTAELARELIAVGVGPDVAVAVSIPRSAEMLLAIHAIAAAGGQYVPVDVDAPADRARAMLRAASAQRLLVADRAAVAAIVEVADELGVGVTQVTADRAVDPGTAAIAAAERITPLRPDHAAYTLFTSGSTGVPKGVTVSHRAIANRIAWMQDRYPVAVGDVVAQKTPYTFDVSVWELFWPFTVGATLTVLDPGRHGDPEHLAEVIARDRVSVLHFVPSMLSTFVEVLGPQRLAALDTVRLLFTSGEALTVPTAQSVLAALPAIGLHNLYGPTEAAVDVTGHQVLAGETTVPIGRPVPNTTAMVLDNRLRPVPPGVAGELYLGGVQVARGYAAQPALSAERFVADPSGAPGSRLYRTGDRVRWNRGGELEYLGRIDFQVKLRGQRLELGEIEAVVAAVPGVVHTAATVVSGPAGDQLVAYVAPAEGVDLDAVRGTVARSLPEYMRPSVWVPLDVMPLSSAGKVNRRELPRPQISEATYVAPANEVERAVADVFADVLGIDQVGVTESFFDLGGNSLAATRVIARIRDRHNLPVELAWLFSDATARGLAGRIAQGNAVSDDVVITLRPDGSRPALFCVHPAGGLAWFYGGLAPYLTDRPIHGLQDPHVVTGEPTETDAHRLAERYVDEIRRIQPSGPYHLLGWSVGGVIAQAMATRLQELGESVAFLGIMDSRPEDEQELDHAASVPESSTEAADGAEGPDGSVVVDILGGWRELFDLGDDVHAATPEEVTEIIRGQIAGMGLLDAGQVQRIMDSFESSARVVMDFRPTVFTGDMLVFTATADKDDPAAMAESWRPFVTGTVTNVDVDTHHLGMADADSLAVIGPLLDAAVNASDDVVGPPNILDPTTDEE